MGLDRTISWTRPKYRPSRLKIRQYLEDFLSDAGSVHWLSDRFFVDLPGKGSDARRRILGRTSEPREERWVEVWLEPTAVCVMTLQHDQFTNALAERIAADLAGLFNGTRGSS